jgi:hypothetical protein
VQRSWDQSAPGQKQKKLQGNMGQLLQVLDNVALWHGGPMHMFFIQLYTAISNQCSDSLL